MRAAWALAVSGILLPSMALADEGRPYAADRAGVLVVVTTATSADPRPRSLAAGFVQRGIESFVAHEMTQPPRDADRRIIRGRWRLDDARRLRRRRRYQAAADAAEDAARLFADAASERDHLGLLVDALLERGTAAVLIEDPATAETVFLEALALDPGFEPDAELYPQEARRLFSAVRRASRQLRFANLVVDAPRLPGAEVEVDFTGPRDPPYETKLSEGRHFISVTAPGRHPVVVAVTARAERQQRVDMFPPLAGDGRSREQALRAFTVADAASVVDLAQSSGLRFVLTARPGSSQVELQLYDGRTGQLVSAGAAILSGQPSPAEIGAAIDQLTQAILQTDDGALEVEGQPGWYGTWWGITIISVVVAGAAAGTAIAVTSRGPTQYQFEP